jgi:translation initiation factor 5B
LQPISGNGIPAKKVVYGTRKKKGPPAKEVSATDSRPRSPEFQSEAVDEKISKSTEGNVKDDWDASSEADHSKALVGVKDDWDATSEEDNAEPVKSTPAVTEKQGMS